MKATHQSFSVIFWKAWCVLDVITRIQFQQCGRFLEANYWIKIHHAHTKSARHFRETESNGNYGKMLLALAAEIRMVWHSEIFLFTFCERVVRVWRFAGFLFLLIMVNYDFPRIYHRCTLEIPVMNAIEVHLDGCTWCNEEKDVKVA